MTALDALRSRRNLDDSVMLDASDLAFYREGVLALYGGEDEARERFPQLYRALQEACENLPAPNLSLIHI